MNVLYNKMCSEANVYINNKEMPEPKDLKYKDIKNGDVISIKPLKYHKNPMSLISK